MKKLKLLLILAIIAFTACEKEDALQYPENTTADFIQTQTISNRTSTITYELEPALEWAAYITAKIVQDSTNTAQRSYVLSQLNNDIIAMEDLIGANVPLNGQSFKNLFETYVNGYFDFSVGNPGDDEERPPCPHCGDSTFGENSLESNNSNNRGLETTDYFSPFAEFLLNDNCVELYFPDGINTNNWSDVTSVGHPLTTANSNEGIRRFINSLGGTTFFEDTEGVNVSNTYIYPNVIVARPIRQGITGPCLYTQYTGVDFTDFLD